MWTLNWEVAASEQVCIEVRAVSSIAPEDWPEEAGRQAEDGFERVGATGEVRGTQLLLPDVLHRVTSVRHAHLQQRTTKLPTGRQRPPCGESLEPARSVGGKA